MSYAAAIMGLKALGHELHTAPGHARRKFDLEHMRILMGALGSPQRTFASVLIAGTNGKGSTSAFLASILREAGYRTGLYTSPHLSRPNERIQVDGAAIGNEDFAALYFQVEEAAAELVRMQALPQMPSFFETLTAMGFLYFARQHVHTAVVEVGMGGRLDATNIVEPILSVITDISLDHTEWLGSTIGAIAREKAGILRSHGVMVTLPQHPEASQVLGEVALSLDVRAVNAADYVPSPLRPGDVPEAEQAGGEADSPNRYPLMVLGERIEIDSPLAGIHQRRNLALAVAAAVELSISNSYNINAEVIRAGIRNTVWPGRLELFPGHPAVLLDVGHNPAGAWSLRAAIARIPQPLTLVFGCLKDKPLAEMAQILFPCFARVVVTEVDSPRSTSLGDLLAAARAMGSVVEAADSAETALKRAREITPPDGLVVVTGSVYLVGGLRDAVRAAADAAEILQA